MKNINQKNTQENTYMSLNKISYGYDIDPVWASGNWLSEPTTLEFIQLWESLHNTSFNSEKYTELCSCALSKGTYPSISELQNKCNIKSMFIDKDFNDDIFIHKDLAIDFASWISPAFRTFCLLLAQKDYLKTVVNFTNEEDFIISNKTLAKCTKELALQNYKSQVDSFVYNCRLLSK